MKKKEVRNIKTPCLIAEIGLNHCGSLKRAENLTALAFENGADLVKYQYFSPSFLINEPYYNMAMGSSDNHVIQTLEKLQLNKSDFIDLVKFNDENDFRWGTSFFSYEDVDDFFRTDSLINSKTFSFIKVASGEITDYPMLESLALYNKNLNLPVIISCGLSTTNEIKRALSFFRKDALCYLLHCIVEYPVVSDNLNLSRIKYLSKRFNLVSGFSDHSLTTSTAILSLYFGSKIVEKHFTDSRELKEADNAISMEPKDFKEISYFLKNFEKVRGNPKGSLSEKEVKELTYARKGIYSKDNIKKDNLINKNCLTTQRPNLGSNDAKLYYQITNKKAKKDINKGDPINRQDIF
jgi:sialic acid synthase SpsE